MCGCFTYIILNEILLLKNKKLFILEMFSADKHISNYFIFVTISMYFILRLSVRSSEPCTAHVPSFSRM